MRTHRWPTCTTKGFRRRPCEPTWTSSARPSTTSSLTSRAPPSRDRRDRRAAGRRTCVARIDAPLSVVPAVRGARTLVEAREFARQVLEPGPSSSAPTPLRRSSASPSSARARPRSSTGSVRARPGAESGGGRPARLRQALRGGARARVGRRRGDSPRRVLQHRARARGPVRSGRSPAGGLGRGGVVLEKEATSLRREGQTPRRDDKSTRNKRGGLEVIDHASALGTGRRRRGEPGSGRAQAGGADGAAGRANACPATHLRSRGEDLRHAVARPRRVARASRARPHVLLRPDRVPADPCRQRGPVRAPLWLARWLQRNGYGRSSSSTSRTSTTRSTTRRPARAPASRRRTRRGGTSRTRIGSGSDGPTSSRRRSRRSPTRIAMIEELVEQGYAYESDGDVYFRVARFAEYGGLRGSVRRRSRSRSRIRARRTRGTSPSGRRTSRGRTRGGSRRGPRPTRLAHRVLGHVREAPRARVRDPRRRPRPRLPASRERARAVGRAGHRFARVWMHNGMLEFGGVEMHKSVGNDVCSRTRSTAGAARRCCSSS